MTSEGSLQEIFDVQVTLPHSLIQFLFEVPVILRCYPFYVCIVKKLFFLFVNDSIWENT
jgi:hypothetical protein